MGKILDFQKKERKLTMEENIEKLKQLLHQLSEIQALKDIEQAKKQLEERKAKDAYKD